MKTLSVSAYDILLKKVERALLLGHQKIEEARVLTYWQTGCLINEYLRKSDTPYQERGEQIVTKLAEDLEFGEKVFYRCMRFAESFPNFSARRKLSWAHYRALIAVPDEKKRLTLADRAAKGEWSSRDLEIEIRNLLWDERAEKLDGKAPSLLEVPALGPFFTYKIIRPEAIHSRASEPLIDLGFSTVLELNRVSDALMKPDSIVTSSKDAKGLYSLEKTRSSNPSRPVGDLLYTYQSFVERVVDGDTLKVEIDLGFNIRICQTIRLKGIDCPEMDASEGQAAKRFVERELAHCEFITLRSIQTRKEKWGRYLADVFYIDKAGKQLYLNNLLLEKGHAVKVRE